MDMPVRPARVFATNRSKELPKVQQSSQPMVYSAPINGLVTTISISEASEGSASISTNWIPTMKGMRIRGGSLRKAILVNPAPVGSMFSYKFGTVQKMFAATTDAIYDVSSPPTPPATTPVSLGGMTSGEWTTFQHTTTGGSFLCAFNGTDPRQVYDGTTWGVAPAITFTDGTTSSQIGSAFLFKQRQFLIKSGTMDAYYLGVNSIGGAAAVFPLGGVLKKGGGLLTGFAWSLESGDGPSALCCFVSTEGEVAVYEGDDPSVATSWSLKGVYSIGRLLGKNAFIQAGGDMLIATVSGLVPLASVFKRSSDTLSLDLISRPIDEEWRRCAAVMSFGWSLSHWPERGLIFVSFPFTSAEPDTSFVLNIKTGKWSMISNWRARAYGSIQGSLFFGDANGVIWAGDVTGGDDGQPFKAVYLSHFLPVGGFGRRAQATLAHMYFEGRVNPIVYLFARANGDRSDPPSPPATQTSVVPSDWDVGKWDEALWDSGAPNKGKIQRRQNVRATGDTMALGCVVTSGGSTALQLEIDMGVLQVAAGESSA